MTHSGKTITFATDLLPNEDDVYSLGNSTKKWKIPIASITDADASTSARGLVNTTAQMFGGKKTFRYTSRIYPILGISAERSTWYKITFPYYNATTDTQPKWFMNSFDLHIGGGYSSNASGVAQIEFYWMRAASNGAWSVQTSAKMDGILLDKITLYYRTAEPGILYIKNNSNQYNGVWINNLYVDDTSTSLDWSNTTIEACDAITADTNPPLSSYTIIPTVKTYSDLSSNYYIDNHTYLNNKNLILYNSASSGDSPSLIFKRAANNALTDWRLYVSGGNFMFQSASNASDWTTRAYFKDSSGDLVLNRIYFKVNSDVTSYYISSTDYTGTAAKATADADNNIISSTYLKKSGGQMTGSLTIGSRETTTTPSEETSIDRVIITPYFHTGGPWKISSADDSSSAFLKLFYGSSELIKIKHNGTITLTKALPISEGGTGKTTASEAWTALGGGASGKHDDSYFVKAITSTDNAIVRYNETNGQVQNSLITINDNGTMSFPTEQDVNFRMNRKNASGGGWAHRYINWYDNSNNIFANIGIYGQNDTFDHMYIGSNEGYTSDLNLQIYANGTIKGKLFSGSGASLTNLNGSNIASGTVSASYIDSAIARLASPVFTGTPTAPTAADGTNTTQIATTAFVMSQFKYNDAMIYKGVVNSNNDLPTTHYQGWTYKVATAGTYAGIVCEIGDIIICNTDGTAANNAHWNVIQTNIDGAVTSSSTDPVDNDIARFDGTTGRIIQKSGITIDDSKNLTIPQSIYFGNNTNATNGKAILAFNSTYPKYGIWYKDTTNDIMSFSASGNADSGTSADFAIEGGGKLYNKGNIIPNTGNNTGTVGSTVHPVYINAGVITSCKYPSSGAYFTSIPYIASDGVMEIGKYIDFHTTDTSTSDYDVRITAATTGLTISGTTSGTFSGNLTGNVTGNCSGSAGSVAWANTGHPDTFPPSAHTHANLKAASDSRGTATTPNDYNLTYGQLIFHGLKTNTAIGSPYTDSYSYLLGLRGWSDSSGGNAHELAFNGNGIYRRQGATTTWNNWFHILDSNNTAAGTNNNETLVWSTTYTIAKINGTDIKFTTMAKPTYTYSDVGAAPSSTVSCTTANVKSALSISSSGSATKWLNEQGSFTTPTAANVGALASDTVITNVSISADITTNKDYALVFGTTPSDGTTPTAAKTEGLQKNSAKFYINPSTGIITSPKFYATSGPGFHVKVAATNWAYMRLEFNTTATKYWDIAAKSNDSSGALQFRPNGLDGAGLSMFYDTSANAAHSFYADADNLYTLGTSTFQWKEAYSQSYVVDKNVTLQYNSTDQALEFIFA